MRGRLGLSGVASGILSKRVVDSANFPALTKNNHRDASPIDSSYNCIAWAAHDTERRWWPQRVGGWYWPPGVSCSETLDAFISAFRLLGYEPCATGKFELHMEKLCLYVLDGAVKHAARQTADGHWTSKLGLNVDIEHDSPEDVAGPLYGQPAAYLARSRSVEHPRPPAKSPGRNDPCWCGRGRKYKHCHGS